jgi:hypothetical protein
MKRYYAGFVVIALLASGLSTGPANAVPPTVTPSPGYDARLQEQRAATARVIDEPVIRPAKRRHVSRPHVRRTYDGGIY